MALHRSDKIFRSLDNDDSDAIDFREYLLGLAPLLKGSDQDILRCACAESTRSGRSVPHASACPRGLCCAVAFSACDLDGNGTIDSQELELLLDAGILEGEAAVAMIKVREAVGRNRRHPFPRSHVPVADAGGQSSPRGADGGNHVGGV